MRRTLIAIATLTLTLIAGGNSRAEDPNPGRLGVIEVTNPDQMRAKAKEIIARGKELREAGKKDQAAAYFARAKELLAWANNENAKDRKRGERRERDQRREGELRGEQREAQRREIIGRLEQIGRQIGELKKAGKLDKAEALIREGGELKKRLKQLSGKGEQRDEKRGRGNYEEFERYVVKMKKHIGQLAREGKREEAEKLEQQLHKKIEAFKKHHAGGEKRGHDERHQAEVKKFKQYVAEARKNIEHLAREGNRDAAEELKRNLARKIEAVRRQHAKHEGGHEHAREHGEHHEHDGHHEHGEEWQRKVHHLRVAADNLEAAGQRDLAHNVRREAEKIQREHEGHHHAEELERHVHELEREIKRLRGELEKARK
jgi:hypothetical protein